MKISLINTNDISGGAARAAFRLHNGFLRQGHNSTMLVKQKNSDASDIFQIIPDADEYNAEQEIFTYIQKNFIDQNRSALSDTIFSFPYPGYNISGIDIIQNTDIINLHWVSKFQSTETIRSLLSLGKPVVWTLHDENPYTGGCHYTGGCKKYQTDCKDCPQLLDHTYQIPFCILRNKQLYLTTENLTIVTPSKWLAECARTSSVFKDLRIEKIPNSIDTELFKPVQKEIAREELGLSPDTFIILFGSELHKDKRKGYQYFLKALAYCMKQKKFITLCKKNYIRLLTFGKPDSQIKNFGIPIISFGFVNNDTKLRTIYSASDIYILPSIEDNLPNNLLESMACGTPVIGFATGGIPDLIKNEVTGYTAPCFNTEKMGEAIITIANNRHLRTQLSLNCRKLIEDSYDLAHQAKNYENLFMDLQKNNEKMNNRQYHFVTAKRESNNTILLNWQSAFPEDLIHLYKKVALKLIARGNEAHEKTIKDIYNSVSYKLGNFFVKPIFLLKKMITKMITSNRNQH